MSRCTISARAGGTSGFSSRTGVGSLNWCAIIFSAEDPSGNGYCPVRQKYRTQPRLYWSPAGVRFCGSMIDSGLAQSRPLATELAVDIVSTSDSPSVSANRQPMPKSRM